MKKVLIFGVIVSFLVVLVIMYLHHIPIPTENMPTSVNIITLPSPPHNKVITDFDNIDLVFKMIKSSDLKPIFYSEKGWQIRLIYRGGDISMIEDKISINGRWFKANNNISSIFKDFYLNLDYEEKLWR